jgi:copper(I)-binding protein
MLLPPGRSRALKAAAGACALVAAAGTAGCAATASADQARTPAIQAGTAYVPLPITPGATDVYLAIRNNGGRDSLVSARLSVGGRVSFRVPGTGSAMRTVPAIAIPAHGITRLVPDGPHLVVTGAGPMRNGKVITLTLRFRIAGLLNVTALVTNPQDTGGDNAYMNID